MKSELENFFNVQSTLNFIHEYRVRITFSESPFKQILTSWQPDKIRETNYIICGVIKGALEMMKIEPIVTVLEDETTELSTIIDVEA